MVMQQIPKRSFRYSLGHVFREAGETLDGIGCWLQGSLAYKEQLNRTRRVMNFVNKQPKIQSRERTFIAPNASVIGEVQIGENSSLWYGSIVRGDVGKIIIGSQVALMDRVCVHVSSSLPEGTVIGDNVVVEPGAILHGCIIGNNSYIGTNSTLLDGVKIGDYSMVAPGSVVTPHTVIPSGQLWSGTPAKYVRDLTEEEKQSIAKSAQEASELSKVHQEETNKELETIEREIAYVENKEDKLSQYTYVPPKNAA
jgi:carbonic anhydrase/acetyltransferase-like protein (isoleucine patch superfamily)